jgi:hypothetical protein
MGREHRLRSLQMRVRRDDDPGIDGASFDKGTLQLRNPHDDAIHRIAHPEAEIGRYLVVAAATGMKFSTYIAEPIDQRLFDVHVDVFQLDAHLKATVVELSPYLLQCSLDLLLLVRRDEANRRQHPRMGDRALDVLTVKAVIEADALGELLNPAVGSDTEDAGPRWSCQAVPLCFSVMGDEAVSTTYSY